MFWKTTNCIYCYDNKNIDAEHDDADNVEEFEAKEFE